MKQLARESAFAIMLTVVFSASTFGCFETCAADKSPTQAAVKSENKQHSPSVESAKTTVVTTPANKSAVADYLELKSFLIGFAQQELKEHDEFYPFGAGIDQKGGKRAFDADPAEGEKPDVNKSAQTLLAVWVKKKDKSYRSFALCLNTVIPLEPGQKTDALKIMLRSDAGAPRDLLIPYKKAHSGKYIFSPAIVLQPDDPNTLLSPSKPVSDPSLK